MTDDHESKVGAALKCVRSRRRRRSTEEDCIERAFDLKCCVVEFVVVVLSSGVRSSAVPAKVRYIRVHLGTKSECFESVVGRITEKVEKCIVWPRHYHSSV